MPALPSWSGPGAAPGVTRRSALLDVRPFALALVCSACLGQWLTGWHLASTAHGADRFGNAIPESCDPARARACPPTVSSSRTPLRHIVCCSRLSSGAG